MKFAEAIAPHARLYPTIERELSIEHSRSVKPLAVYFTW